MEIVYRDVENRMQPCVEGGEVPLIEPPQGGKVLVVGVRAKNLNCNVEVVASLRDECTGALLARDGRPLRLRPTGDGWGEPEFPDSLTSYSNLPACPRANISRNMTGEPFLLKLQIDDPINGFSISSTVTIVPRCAEPEFMDKCLCECDKNFVGSGCTPTADSGLAPGSCADGGT
jgi:hypothetical protein